MIIGKNRIRVRYDEVDQMGYVYHANYVKFCHIGRTELLREFNIHDCLLEENNIMLPVIDISLNFKKPANYDDLLIIYSCIMGMTKTRLHFKFEIKNDKEELICNAESTVVFVNSKTRKPIKAPDIIVNALLNPNQNL